MTGNFTFPAIPVAWSFADGPRAKRIGPVQVDTDGDLSPDALLAGTSNFLAGQSPDRLAMTKITSCPCSEMTCHTDPATGKIHCSIPPPPPGCMTIRCAE